VPRAFERWHREGKIIAIFSSGSVLAQRLLFRSSTHGDLAPFIQSYFDTATGPKKEAQSYTSIARALSISPAGILFVSEVPSQLDAAWAAGMRTVLCIRPGAPESRGDNAHPIIRTFGEIVFSLFRRESGRPIFRQIHQDLL
jgi:enolase-phosphatase E1